MGTLVWDSIHGPGGGEPFQDWGGIAYSLAAFEAVAPPGWEAVPIVKVGADLEADARDFFASLRRVATLEHVVSVPAPNNRVDLFYHDRSRRCERLVGGVPGWSWEELAEPALSCDALYVNFIAGWELDLDTVMSLSERVEAPTYCDVHSLLLQVAEDGMREPRPLARRADWMGSFDLVQVNEDELSMLSERGADRTSKAEDILSDGPEGVFVTLGATGAEWLVRRGSRWAGPGGSDVRGFVPVETAVDADPTGCGDVWGVTAFTALLDGGSLEKALAKANRIAVRCAAGQGTAGLARTLAEESPLLEEVDPRA